MKVEDVGAQDPAAQGPQAAQDALRLEAWRAVYEAGDAIRQWIFAMAHSKELSAAQAHLLTKLEPETPVTMSQAAQLLGCDASNVTGLTDRLERRGLLERRPSPTDRRVKMLALTASGQALRQELAEAFGSLPTMLADLSDDELRSLRDLMQRVASSRQLIGVGKATACDAPRTTGDDPPSCC